jgi:hypothetical protein
MLVFHGPRSSAGSRQAQRGFTNPWMPTVAISIAKGFIPFSYLLKCTRPDSKPCLKVENNAFSNLGPTIENNLGITKMFICLDFNSISPLVTSQAEDVFRAVL